MKRTLLRFTGSNRSFGAFLAFMRKWWKQPHPGEFRKMLRGQGAGKN